MDSVKKGEKYEGYYYLKYFYIGGNLTKLCLYIHTHIPVDVASCKITSSPLPYSFEKSKVKQRVLLKKETLVGG